MSQVVQWANPFVIATLRSPPFRITHHVVHDWRDYEIVVEDKGTELMWRSHYLVAEFDGEFPYPQAAWLLRTVNATEFLGAPAGHLLITMDHPCGPIDDGIASFSLVESDPAWRWNDAVRRRPDGRLERTVEHRFAEQDFHQWFTFEAGFSDD